MHKTKFMTRIFSAIKNEETQVLDQLDKDIDIAKEDGFCDASQYTITASDDEIILHDHVNDEDTKIIEDENGEVTFAAVEDVAQAADDAAIEEEENDVPNPLNEVPDETLDEAVVLASCKASKIKQFSLNTVKKFAKGGWRDGKLYIKMGDSDVALDLKNKVAIIIDENLSCPIDPKKSFIDNLTAIEKFMKENDLKVFSDENKYTFVNQDGVEKSWTLSTLKSKWSSSSDKTGPKLIRTNDDADRIKEFKDNKGNIWTRKFSDTNPTPEQEVFSDKKYVVTFAPFKGNNNVGYIEVMTKDNLDKKLNDPGNYQVYNVLGEFDNKDKAKELATKERSKIITPSEYIKKMRNKYHSDADPTPEQEGVINFLKGFVEEHPGEAKYLVELGNKWGADNLLEGLNHDAEGDREMCNKFSKFSPAVQKMFGKKGSRSDYPFYAITWSENSGDPEFEIHYISNGGVADRLSEYKHPVVKEVKTKKEAEEYVSKRSKEESSKKFSKFSPAVQKMFSTKYTIYVSMGNGYVMPDPEYVKKVSGALSKAGFKYRSGRGSYVNRIIKTDSESDIQKIIRAVSPFESSSSTAPNSVSVSVNGKLQRL